MTAAAHREMHPRLFELTPSQALVRDTARDFARKVLAPIAGQLDRERRFPACEFAAACAFSPRLSRYFRKSSTPFSTLTMRSATRAFGTGGWAEKDGAARRSSARAGSLPAALRT